MERKGSRVRLRVREVLTKELKGPGALKSDLKIPKEAQPPPLNTERMSADTGIAEKINLERANLITRHSGCSRYSERLRSSPS